jgi:hypothetical protein
MSDTVTGSYRSADQIRNVEDDLRASGLPRENLFIDEPAKKIRIIIAQPSKPGIVEILERHGLTEITQ